MFLRIFDQRGIMHNKKNGNITIREMNLGDTINNGADSRRGLRLIARDCRLFGMTIQNVPSSTSDS